LCFKNSCATNFLERKFHPTIYSFLQISIASDPQAGAINLQEKGVSHSPLTTQYPATHWYSPTTISDFLDISCSLPGETKECTPSLFSVHRAFDLFIGFALTHITSNLSTRNSRELTTRKTTSNNNNHLLLQCKSHKISLFSIDNLDIQSSAPNHSNTL
jgi:hypothetical protein